VTCSSLRASNAAAMNARHGGRRSACSFTPPLCCGYVRSGLPSTLSGFCGLRNRYRLVRGGDGGGRTRCASCERGQQRQQGGTSLCGPAHREGHIFCRCLARQYRPCLLARCRCSRCRGRTCSSTASVGKRRRFECAFATVANVGGCPGCVAGRRGSASCCSGCSPR